MISPAGLSNGSVQKGGLPSGAGIPVEDLGVFLRRLAHDVRNDLSALKLLFACLQERGAEDAGTLLGGQIEEALRHGTRRMSRVARAFEPPSVEAMDYPLDLFFEDFKARATSARPDSSARIEWKLDGERQQGFFDPALAMEALDELLDNALAFSPHDSPLWVSAAGQDAGVAWRFRQSIELAPDGCDQWGRTPLGGSRKGGYGLGLFRARRIVEAHGGRLEFVYAADRGLLVAEAFFPGGDR
jgi:signal transduction histidine kinase